jgi:hypothetical protein
MGEVRLQWPQVTLYLNISQLGEFIECLLASIQIEQC